MRVSYRRLTDSNFSMTGVLVSPAWDMAATFALLLGRRVYFAAVVVIVLKYLVLEPGLPPASRYQESVLNRLEGKDLMRLGTRRDRARVHILAERRLLGDCASR